MDGELGDEVRDHCHGDAGDEGRQAARHLQRLLPLEIRAEYESAPMRAADAEAVVLAAERLIGLAALVLAAAPLPAEGGGSPSA